PQGAGVEAEGAPAVRLADVRRGLELAPGTEIDHRIRDRQGDHEVRLERFVPAEEPPLGEGSAEKDRHVAVRAALHALETEAAGVVPVEPARVLEPRAAPATGAAGEAALLPARRTDVRIPGAHGERRAHRV